MRLKGIVTVLAVAAACALGPLQPTYTQLQPQALLQPAADNGGPDGFDPSTIARVYGFDHLKATGKGQLIAVVTAHGSPTIEGDLAVFSKRFGLPEAKLTVAYPQGTPAVNSAWALETALDVEWIHALAPDAPLLLVAAKTAGIDDMMQAVKYAAQHGAKVVSMSFGRPEFAGADSYDGNFDHPGTVFVAASGDLGHGVNWPAVSPKVVAVGGTTMWLDRAGTAHEYAWAGSGGGISRYVTAPQFQAKHGVDAGGKRAVPDVSFSADPRTGALVFSSTNAQNQPKWLSVGGTSFAVLGWAALFARADELRETPLTDGNAALYALAQGDEYDRNYREVTRGINGTCGSLCRARPGYNMVTGLGTVNANELVPRLANT